MKRAFTFILLTIVSFNSYAFNCSEFKQATPEFTKCDGKNVHLSFDDGPNTTTTPKILSTLKKHKIPATFFISTHQLEKGDLNKKKMLLNDMLDNGFTIASHGHDHNCHDLRYDWQGNLQAGYSDKERREQLNKSVSLLDEFTNNGFSNQKLQLLRFPYGRGISPSEREINTMIQQGRNIQGSNYRERLAYYREHSPAMSIASEYNLSHVGWNHDSKDSTTKYNETNKDTYIKDTINYLCNSTQNNLMSLFHDTRKINSLPSSIDSNDTVMGEIIKKAKCLGVNFQSMDKFLENLLQTGVYTKAYEGKSQVQEIVSQLEQIGAQETTCNQDSTPKISSGQSCVSEYVGVVEHCNGNSSYCIDGQWVSSKDIFTLVCESNLDAEVAKNLSSNYLNKNCSTPSKREDLEKGSVVCYCQEDSKQNNQLKWNCFDISSGQAVKIN